MRFRETVGIMLTIVLASMSALAFNIAPLMAEGNGYLEKTSSGKIAYDTFSAFNGTATDIPWTIIEDLERNVNGNWTVEDGKFKSVSFSGTTAAAYPTDVKVTDFIWEAKVRPMLLTKEGPEIIVEDQPINFSLIGAVFDYYHTGNVLRVMIKPSREAPHSTYQTTSFVMNEGVWYTMKVAVSGSNMKCYIDDILKFDVLDSNLETAPPRVLVHIGYYNGEWGYWDDVKIWKSNTISIINLQKGQKVELYDNANNLKSSDTVGTGETQAVLDVSALTFPFTGYFKIYSMDGVTLLHTSVLYQDIWGGDEYSFSAPPVKKLSIRLSGNFDYSSKEEVKVKLAALVKDADTMETVSDANVTIEIYYPNGTLWVSDEMVETLAGTGIYEWESSDTINQMKLEDGVYLVYVKASVNNSPMASEILLFHIDSPLGISTSSLTPLIYYVTAIIILITGTIIGLALFMRHRRLQKIK